MERVVSLRGAILGLSLSAACTAAALAAGVAAPRPAQAQASTCSNTECHGVSYCVYSPRERCSMLSASSCLNQRCAFADN